MFKSGAAEFSSKKLKICYTHTKKKKTLNEHNVLMDLLYRLENCSVVVSVHQHLVLCAQEICGRKWRTTALTWMRWERSVTPPSDYQTVTLWQPASLPSPVGWACRCRTCRWQGSTPRIPRRTPGLHSTRGPRPTASPLPCFKSFGPWRTFGEKKLFELTRKLWVNKLMAVRGKC